MLFDAAEGRLWIEGVEDPVTIETDDGAKLQASTTEAAGPEILIADREGLWQVRDAIAERIADATAQQSGAVSEIRGHSERIHTLGGDNLRRIGQSRQQGEQLLLLGGELHTAVQAFRV